MISIDHSYFQQVLSTIQDTSNFPKELELSTNKRLKDSGHHAVRMKENEPIPNEDFPEKYVQIMLFTAGTLLYTVV